MDALRTRENTADAPPPRVRTLRVRSGRDPEDARVWYCLERIPCGRPDCRFAPNPDLHGPYWFRYFPNDDGTWRTHRLGPDCPHNPLDVDRSPEALDRIAVETDALLAAAGTAPTVAHVEACGELLMRLWPFCGDRVAELRRQLALIDLHFRMSRERAVDARFDALQRKPRLSPEELEEMNRLSEILSVQH